VSKVEHEIEVRDRVESIERAKAIVCRQAVSHAKIGYRPILDGIDCEIKRGEFVAILGLNGAGKSSLLRAIAGLMPLTSGIIKIGDTLLSPQTISQARQDIAMLFQGGGLIPQLSAIDNVLCGKLSEFSGWQTLLKFPAQERQIALELLDRLGMADFADRPTHRLSGGQQQRVAIARALIKSPQILLADEPVTGLDIVAIRQLMQILVDLHREGMTIVTVLHDLTLASKYADTAIIVDRGRVIYHGSSQHIDREFDRLIAY
jgi:phosphonate transport system ATP-binding protein